MATTTFIDIGRTEMVVLAVLGLGLGLGAVGVMVFLVWSKRRP